MPDLDRLLTPITEFPWQLLEYRRWLEEGNGQPTRGGDYLFVEEVARFQPREEDLLVGLASLRVTDERGEVRVRAGGQAGPELLLSGISKVATERLLGLVDGRRTLVEIELQAGPDLKAWRSLLRRAFGVLLFAPGAVEGLERRLSGTEIVRFPGSPYQVVRSYWENMIAVREHLAEKVNASTLQETRQFLQLLRELNVLVLMGADLATFYRPASPIGQKGVTPGALLETKPRLVKTDQGYLFVSGPRVNASLLGGATYSEALFQALGDLEARSSREVMEGDLPWGRVVDARTIEEAEVRTWFCPPRPIREAHWTALRESLSAAWNAAQRGEAAATVQALALFHQRFVRLHPFRCANQSVAMSIVNFVLSVSHRAGIPHLTLDHLAFRLSSSAYQKAFEAAIRGHLLAGVGPLARYTELGERKRRMFQLVSELDGCPNPAAALALGLARKDASLAYFPTT